LTGGLAGYHSTNVAGFDVENQRMWLRNSWGDWSVEDGYFYYTFANLQKLLAAGATMVCPASPLQAANDNAAEPLRPTG
jgi:C1A family cysteine protease